MKKLLLSVLTLGLVSAGVVVSHMATATASGPVKDSEVVANVLSTAGTSNINALPAIDSPAFSLPPAAIDVMRVRMEEAYTIEGVGTDTVELRGWIATKHNNAYAAAGQKEVKWGTAVIDTEFVGLELEGHSKIFGPVKVSLNPAIRSVGKVGAIDVPELKGKEAMFLAKSNSTANPETLAKCAAAVAVNVTMPQLDLKMSTEQPVRMYSMVENIPPIGQTASISLKSTNLISNDRVVGTLDRAEVKFREIVMRSGLKGDEPIR